MVLHRAYGAGRGNVQTDPGVSHAGPGLRRTHPAPGAPEHVRCAVPARAPVVLESRLCEWTERRGDPAPREARLPGADYALDHAPLSGERSGAPGGRERHRVELPGGYLG